MYSMCFILVICLAIIFLIIYKDLILSSTFSQTDVPVHVKRSAHMELAVVEAHPHSSHIVSPVLNFKPFKHQVQNQISPF